jgi:hypothetical protein
VFVNRDLREASDLLPHGQHKHAGFQSSVYVSHMQEELEAENMQARAQAAGEPTSTAVSKECVGGQRVLGFVQAISPLDGMMC